MIYFDNGASTHPKPPCVIRAMGNWTKKNGANPGRSGHRLSMEAAELIYNTREAYASFFGLDRSEKVILVPNATYALNTVILGLFEKGDHIVTTDLEHNSVLRPLFHLQKSGIDVTVVSVDLEDDTVTTKRILNAVNDRTKAIICTQCSNVCGRIMPIEMIGKNKPKDVLLIVDGSQGAGTININVSLAQVDYYCAPSHKGLMGPQGGGVLLINNRLPRPLVFGGTGTESMRLEQPENLPEHLESGTLPSPICAGMLAALEFIQSVGIQKIFEHKKRLTAYAYNQLANIDGIELYCDFCADQCLGVVPFNMREKRSFEVAGWLDMHEICVRGGLHCAPLFHHKMGTGQRGMVRVSFGYMNQKSEIDFLTSILKKYTINS